MRGSMARLGVLGLLIGSLALPGSAGAGEAETVQEILGILKNRGLVDDAEYNRLVSGYAASQSQRSWLDRFSFKGDFRARHESFWYDRDELGNESDNRYRGRYRIRLGMKFDVNDWADVHLRLASGQDDLRSTNQTFGSGVDFDPDSIFIDRAYVELEAPGQWMPEGSKAHLLVGKQGNPFTWKVGKDFMLWDGDVNPEGVGLKLAGDARDNLSWFLHSGYFVIDEESGNKDPHLFGVQLGGEVAVSDDLALGARGTYYTFRSVLGDFLQRGIDGTGGSTSSGGNLPGGLTDTDENFDVTEVGAYLKWAGSEMFPVTIYGNWSQNLDAEDTLGPPGTDEEDTAWGVGIEVGDKNKLAKLGVGYWEIEANAFPSQFIDSDLFDGFTNREGWAIYGSRNLFKNTDLNLTFFMSDEIEDGSPAFDESVEDAERYRLQTDLVFKF